MKRFTVILFLMLAGAASVQGQKLSARFQSMCDSNMGNLSAEHKRKIDTLLIKRLSGGMLMRMDTLKYDYLFITERFDYSHSTFDVSEKYFMTGNDTVKYNFEDGQPGEVFKDDLKFWTKYYSGLKEKRSIPYQHLELREHDRWCQPVREFKREIKKSLRATYQIMAMIDRKKNIIKISAQYPVKKPFIVTFYVGGGKC